MTNASRNLPKISVVIPAYNEMVMLPYCLKALRQQDYRGDYEIIVVDNASTDKTAEIAHVFKAKIVYEATRGVAYARRAGFRAATGGIIASTDADTIVPSNWLSQIEQVLSDPRIDGIVGAYSLCNTNSFSKKFIQGIIPFFRLIDRVLGCHFAGANFAVRKSAYDSVGGFDLTFATGEDLDLSYRLRKMGYRLQPAYHIKVRTSARRLNEGFWYTFVNYIVKNWLSLVFLHHPYLQKLSAVREEPTELKKSAHL